MKIQIASVKERSRSFHFEETLVLSGLGDRAGEGRVDVSVQVDPAGERWYLSTRVDAVFPFVCDRCSDHFTGRLSSEFKLIVLARAMGGLDPEESDEVLLLPPDSQEIDLGDKVAEALWLELPIQVNCVTLGGEPCARYDADEMGADVQEAGEEEIDPRWRVLKELKTELQKAEAGEAEAAESED